MFFYFCFVFDIVDWIKESGLQDSLSFEELAEEELAVLLKDFCVRSKKNQLYPRSALKGLRAGLQRHLEGKPYYCKFCISKDQAFNEAHFVFTGYLSKLHKDGLDTTAHKAPILPGDMS